MNLKKTIKMTAKNTDITGQKRFTERASVVVREEISSCGGQEVFFLGRLDPDGLVSEVEVWARGNDNAVPALMNVASAGDVVIHNHPSGILTPSNADIDIASRLGASGVGFYIVDNECARVYPVVEPRAQEAEPDPIEPNEIRDIFGPDGSLARVHPNYEPRDSQIDMAAEVIKILESGTVGLLEAGTGTGKSLAYLVPALKWALRGRRRVVVSTRTINLQEQHLKQDLPILEEIVGEPFKAVLFKGRGNYLCFRKRDLLGMDSGEVLLEFDDLREVQQIIDWSRSTDDGSLSDLPFVPLDSNWALFRSESDSCIRARCSYFSTCFFYRARKDGASAQLLLANHHVLFADLSLRSAGQEAAAIMPKYDAVILDEAHNVEDVALSYFGGSISRWALLSHLGKMVSRRNSERGLVPFLIKRLQKEKRIGKKDQKEMLSLAADLVTAVEEKRSLIESAFQSLAQILVSWLEGENGERGGKWGQNPGESSGGGQGKQPEYRWRIPLEKRNDASWTEVTTHLEELVLHLKGVVTPLRKINSSLRELVDEGHDELSGIWGDLGGVFARVDNSIDFLKRIIDGESEHEVFWTEVRSGGRQPAVSLHLTPLDVSPILSETLFAGNGPVIMTSATMTVGGTFDFISERLGINNMEIDTVQRKVFATPFDMAVQMKLMVPDSLPEPGKPGYVNMLATAVNDMVKASSGGALVLFTSYRTLEAVHGKCMERLEREGINVMRQGEAPRTALLEMFRNDPQSALFATDSFWEGIDVVGSSLRNVIITRLPFPVPTDPVNEARSEMMIREGRDPFWEDSIPRAVIRLRQGIGRLIRHRNDAGCAVICDSRIVRRSYGAIFIDSLGDVELQRGSIPDLADEIRTFFKDKLNP